MTTLTVINNYNGKSIINIIALINSISATTTTRTTSPSSSSSSTILMMIVKMKKAITVTMRLVLLLLTAATTTTSNNKNNNGSFYRLLSTLICSEIQGIKLWTAYSRNKKQLNLLNLPSVSPFRHFSVPGAGIMEADDRQVTTVFTVQPRFHHRRSTNRVSWSVTIVGERAVSSFVECRWWNDGWTVKTVVTWRSSDSMIPAPGLPR